MLSDSESEDNPSGGTGTDIDEDYLPANNKHNPNLKRPLSTSSSSNDSDEEIQGTGTVPFMLEDVRVTSEDGSDQIPGILENTPQRGKKRLANSGDRSFGAIEIEKRQYDKIYLPQEYSNIIENTNKNFKVIQDIFLNLKTYLQQFFVKNPSRKKFTISKYRIMGYEKLDTEISFNCSEKVFFNLFNVVEFEDRRNVQPLTLTNPTNKMYSERRKLKKNKFDHVMTLAKNYVLQCGQWFYEEIRGYHQSFSSDDKETSASEFNDDDLMKIF
ncbi:unnamed protein product [Psylliodes chrysocephalus]|uniref:Uncharacterized protein n=1 Tax=Psylliodes chrysocephalus TaxID=3402493 RepID=A0A9P0CMG7_9CUCU|nr:unnamed protein product [Psylliodes chrysocephala]